jgi:hypothetical protein
MNLSRGHFPGTDRPLAVAQIDHCDAKLIGEIAKSVKETLLFSGSAFREIHFIKGSGSRPPKEAGFTSESPSGKQSQRNSITGETL